MFMCNLRSKRDFFCLLTILFLLISSVNCQKNENLTGNNSHPAGKQQQQHQQHQQNIKNKSININNKSVTYGDKQKQLTNEEPISESIVLKRNYSSLNNKYETQSTVTSTIGLFRGSKKSEYYFY